MRIFEFFTMKYFEELNNTGTLTNASGVGALLAQIDGTGTAYPFYDANGNVTEYVDSEGLVQAHYEYSPFGKIIVSTGIGPDDFSYRFSTKELEPNTSLVLYQFRACNPIIGRFLSRDPIGEKGGYNLYAILSNDTVNWWDYLGYEPWYKKGVMGKIDRFLTGLTSADKVADGIIETARESDPTIPQVIPELPEPSEPTHVEFSHESTTMAIRDKVAQCVAGIKDCARRNALKKAKEKCKGCNIRRVNATDSYSGSCYAFMYFSIHYVIGGTNVNCKTTATCTYDCCYKTHFCIDNTHCSYKDYFDFNLGLFTLDTGISFIGEWDE